MKKFILALILTGCGSEPFSSAMFHDGDAPDAGGDVVDAPRGTGGAAGGAPSSGGAASGGAGAGGHVVGSGGGTGGVAAATGGASTGGVQAAGGAQATGGAPLTGGASGTGGIAVNDACVPVTHENGFGDTWSDCAARGTHDLEQAMKACKASGAPRCAITTFCGVNGSEICGQDAAGAQTYAGCWGYEGLVVGRFTTDPAVCPVDDASSTGKWD